MVILYLDILVKIWITISLISMINKEWVTCNIVPNKIYLQTVLLRDYLLVIYFDYDVFKAFHKISFDRLKAVSTKWIIFVKNDNCCLHISE